MFYYYSFEKIAKAQNRKLKRRSKKLKQRNNFLKRRFIYLKQRKDFYYAYRIKIFWIRLLFK
mgnify:CR=1 FL=1